MLRTKIAGLAAIGLLAIGVSSPALAEPIFNAFYGTDLVDSDNSIRQYNFSVFYQSCDDDDIDNAGDTCEGQHDLVSFNLVFPFDALVITSDLLALDPLSNEDLFLYDAFVDPSGSATAEIDWIGYNLALPLMGFTFSILVDFGDALFPDGVPEFDFFSGDFYDGLFDLQKNVAAVFDPLLSSEPPTMVPEPGTLVLFGIGLLGMGAARRRKA